jgi:hypothetical protein
MQTHLDALRNANDGFAITVWKDGWKLWRTLDAKYAEHDPDFVMTISGDQIADEMTALAATGHKMRSFITEQPK